MTHSIAYRRMLNRMGYYNYQNGLIYRHLSQQGNWDGHHERCRSFILRAMELYNPEKISVFGSGWLLDFPLTEIVEKAKKVCLIDIVHPPEVISQVGHLQNVELIEEDITGGLIAEVWQKTGKYSFFNKLQSLTEIDIPEYIPAEDPGMVVSLNILTQLESLLVDFLRKRSKIPEEKYSLFRSGIQRKHIEFLKKFRSVLISDTEEIITENNGNVKHIPTRLVDIPSGSFRDEWIWNFDLTGTDYFTSRSVMKVEAIII